LLLIDRYIARQYLINIVVLLVLLGGFVVVVDASLNLSRNITLAGEELARSGEVDPGALRKFLAAGLFILDLWWPRLLQLFNYLNGLVLITAMGFTFAQLVRSREVVATLAGGISLLRLLRPILVIAGIMLMVQVINQELIVPRIAPLILRSNTEIAKRDLDSFPVVLVPDTQGRLWSAAKFDPPSVKIGSANAGAGTLTGTLTGVQVWQRDGAGVATARLSAAAATYLPERGAWRLSGVSISGLEVTAGQTMPAAAVGREPAFAGLTGTGRERTLTTDLDPTSLLADRYKAFAHVLSWSQLLTAANSPTVKPELRESFTRLAWGRGALLVCTVLSLLVCAPFFLTREPKNMVIQSLKCAPVAIGSVIGAVIGTAAEVPGLPPEISVLLPVMALVPMAIASITSVRT